jgi:hypothetical protein
MAFLLAGLIVPANIARLREAQPLHGGYSLVPSERLSFAQDEPLPPTVEETARELSRHGRVVYVEAEFFGGTGAQAAVGWEGGVVAYGPIRTQSPGEGYDGFDEVVEGDDWAVNRALGWLGVRPRGGSDAFAAIGLDRRRSWLLGAD